MEKLYGQVNYHEFDPLNGVAMNDAWAIPNLVLGGKALTTGTGALITNAPYLNDIWQGRNLLLHKPFKWMSKQEFKNYGKIGEQYYKNFLQKNPVNIKEYGKVTFGRHNKGKDNTINMEQYPFLRKNIENSKWEFNSNNKNEPDRTYDHFYNTYRNNLYDYIIEDVNSFGKRYKMMKNKTKNE